MRSCKRSRSARIEITNVCPSRHLHVWWLFCSSGTIPRANNVDEQLEPLTLVEKLLLGIYRAKRVIVVMRGLTMGPDRPASTLEHAYKGHVIAFPNPPPHSLIDTFPCPLEKIPEIIQVVLVGPAADSEKLRDMARRNKLLHVRGKQMILWARHLQKLYERDVDGKLVLQTNGSILQAYETVDGVPEVGLLRFKTDMHNYARTETQL